MKKPGRYNLRQSSNITTLGTKRHHVPPNMMKQECHFSSITATNAQPESTGNSKQTKLRDIL